MRLLNRLTATDFDKLIARFNLKQNPTIQQAQVALATQPDTSLVGLIGALLKKKPKAKQPEAPAMSEAEARDYATSLYREVLGREPDADGLASHVNGLLHGTSKEQLRQIFLDSPEYKEKQSRPPQAAAPAQPEAQASAPAAPAKPAVGSVGPVPLEGYDYGKLNNPSHRTVKYMFGRVASRHPLSSVKDKAASEELLKQIRPELEAEGLKILNVKGDKIQVDIDGNAEWVDVVRGAGSGSPGWWWGPTGESTPTASTPYVPTTPSGPAPTVPTAPPATPGAPGADELANAPIDTSSTEAAILSAATWALSAHPELVPHGDERGKAVQLMTKVIGALNAHGIPAMRVLNHPSLPPENPVRYGSDAVVIDGIIYDCYSGMGESNRPQALKQGPLSGQQQAVAI
jgi:hypothetical protein